MDHWLLEDYYGQLVAEESEDGGSEESSTEEVTSRLGFPNWRRNSSMLSKTVNIAQRLGDRSETLKYGGASLLGGLFLL